jgi:hypothetical protein
MAPTPPPKATPRPTAAPPGNVVPFDSTLIFVLDDPISSKSSKAGEMARVHLKSALVVGNRTLAPAGTPARVRILDVSPSDIADTYGFVDIFFEPMQLPDGRMLPLRAPVARLAPHRSSGHESTVSTEDTVGDIFVPYYSFYQIFRHGKNFVLRAGSELPARTEATITALSNGTIAIATPHPPALGTQQPTATFPVIPVATPVGGEPTPRPKKTPAPTPTPAATPTPTVSPSASP